MFFNITEAFFSLSLTSWLNGFGFGLSHMWQLIYIYRHVAVELGPIAQAGSFALLPHQTLNTFGSPKLHTGIE